MKKILHPTLYLFVTIRDEMINNPHGYFILYEKFYFKDFFSKCNRK